MRAWSEFNDDPLCPHCGEQLTDSAADDLPSWGQAVIECGECGEVCEVEGETTVVYRVRAVES